MSDRFYADLDRILKSQSPSAGWIHFFNGLSILLAILAAPFTFGASLFALLVIPWNSALATIATETYRTRSLMEMQVMMTHDLNNMTSDRWDYDIEADRERRRRALLEQEREWEEEHDSFEEQNDSWEASLDDPSTDFENDEGTSENKNS